jgi:hypothetical protein
MRGEYDSADVRFSVVRVLGDREPDHPSLLLEKQRRPAIHLRALEVHLTVSIVSVSSFSLPVTVTF